MSNKNRAGQIRKAARVIESNGTIAEVGGDIEMSDEALITLAAIATDRDTVAQIEIPLAGVSVICHALSYLRNNPTLDGVLKIEADNAYGVLVIIADEMHDGAAAAFAQVDAAFAAQGYTGRVQ